MRKIIWIHLDSVKRHVYAPKHTKMNVLRDGNALRDGISMYLNAGHGARVVQIVVCSANAIETTLLHL